MWPIKIVSVSVGHIVQVIAIPDASVLVSVNVCERNIVGVEISWATVIVLGSARGMCSCRGVKLYFDMMLCVFRSVLLFLLGIFFFKILYVVTPFSPEEVGRGAFCATV